MKVWRQSSCDPVRHFYRVLWWYTRSCNRKYRYGKIISESLYAGVRRIEAYTGARVEEMLTMIQDTLSDLKALFNNAPDLRIAIRKYLDENAD